MGVLQAGLGAFRGRTGADGEPVVVDGSVGWRLDIVTAATGSKQSNAYAWRGTRVSDPGDRPLLLEEDEGLRWCLQWIVVGTSVSGESLELVCVLDTDEHGEVTVFITIY